ncbi:MAG: histidine triad nucleotide-binding protein [Chloroherpetonaceae bacterium]
MTDSSYNENCIFCKIAAEKIPSKKVYSDEQIFAFHDIAPVAPVHILIIPKRHIETLDDLTGDDAILVGKLIIAAKDIARTLGIADSGYRVNLNCKRDGGQTVFHIHAHLIGGKPMGWPPFPTT